MRCIHPLGYPAFENNIERTIFIILVERLTPFEQSFLFHYAFTICIVGNTEVDKSKIPAKMDNFISSSQMFYQCKNRSRVETLAKLSIMFPRESCNSSHQCVPQNTIVGASSCRPYLSISYLFILVFNVYFSCFLSPRRCFIG